MSEIVLFAGHTELAKSFIAEAVQQHLAIKALVVYGFPPSENNPSTIPVRASSHQTIDDMVMKLPCPVIWACKFQQPQLLTQLSKLEADYILSVCFPSLIPEQVRQLANVASLNIHPSLLPAYRGPRPIFWQLKNAEKHFGISVHIMIDDMDAGPVVIQRRNVLDRNMTELEIEQVAGLQAAEMVKQIISAEISTGLVPQDESQASYYPSPVQ